MSWYDNLKAELGASLIDRWRRQFNIAQGAGWSMQEMGFYTFADIYIGQPLEAYKQDGTRFFIDKVHGVSAVCPTIIGAGNKLPKMGDFAMFVRAVVTLSKGAGSHDKSETERGHNVLHRRA